MPRKSCFSDSVGLFLIDFKKDNKILINIPDIMIVTGQECSLAIIKTALECKYSL